MKIVTYEGIVEHGCVHFPAGVSVPENARVYVVVPEIVEIEVPRAARVPSPRLVHPEQADDFVKEVVDLKGAT
jgi:hypothetical protein